LFPARFGALNGDRGRRSRPLSRGRRGRARRAGIPRVEFSQWRFLHSAASMSTSTSGAKTSLAFPNIGKKPKKLFASRRRRGIVKDRRFRRLHLIFALQLTTTPRRNWGVRPTDPAAAQAAPEIGRWRRPLTSFFPLTYGGLQFRRDGDSVSQTPEARFDPRSLTERRMRVERRMSVGAIRSQTTFSIMEEMRCRLPLVRSVADS
jgi:hypothetical protein